MDLQDIVLKKVAVHNLKKVSLSLKPRELIVFTGVSGSGKSSLAFDTIYVEGQRRYVESLSTFARRHMEDLPKPEAESISGLSPTIAIEQKTIGKNPRSTVGTLTGVYDFLRVLFARIGTPYCPVSGERVEPQSQQKILKDIFQQFHQQTVYILSPYARAKKGEFKDDFNELQRQGFTKVRFDGKICDLQEEMEVDGKKTHDLDLIIDRITLSEENQDRLMEAVITALDKGSGVLSVFREDQSQETLFSTHAYSEKSGLSYGPLEPSDFSFNHPEGMCPSCQGLGESVEFDLALIIDENLSIAEDCCKVASSYYTVRYGNIYNHLAKQFDFDIEAPWKDLSERAKKVFLYGTPGKWTRIKFVHPSKKSSWTDHIQWKGVLHEAKERFQQAKSDSYRKKMLQWMRETTCESCKGSRIKPYPSAVKLFSKTIQELSAMPLKTLGQFFEKPVLEDFEKVVGEELLKEVRFRLKYLSDVGLHYLSLDRRSPSLSGGEAQRVRLAAQLGCGLVGVTYILDEPSIGLHPRDNGKLIATLKSLRDQGNTVIVVEHDEETIRHADTIVDVGPLAGTKGGEILVQGSLEDLLACERSITGAYLSGRKKIEKRNKKRVLEGTITVKGATHHNLKNIDVSIPLKGLIAIAGVSGSGKSSLITDIVYPAVSNALMGSELSVGSHRKIEGLEKIDKIITIDQSAIGRTPRSNPSTYIKLFDDIRDLFSTLPESEAQGFKPGRFSFNVREGSCPHCLGGGMIKIDMDFLEDEWVECSFCHGQRFDSRTLAIHYKGKSIHDVLKMTVAEAGDFFAAIPKISTKLNTLLAVGLDYMCLGQPSPTLSGGEAQRIKLAKELSRPSTGKTLYILDEPTTGLHFHDIHKLIDVLQKLVDAGNTVVVIEHNMDLVKNADWVIELGPEAGEEGGEVIAQATPENLSRLSTPTGKALKQLLHFQTQEYRSLKEKKVPLIDHIIVEGAEQNNLKGVSIKIPRGKITVCTGPSGSGKSSFAFETIYAEGQRRYTESLSHYARQFVKQMPKPKIFRIEGLSPAIAIEQKGHAGNPRSTIGTLTEIYDYLRILYAHLGEAFCPETGEKIVSISKEYVIQAVMALGEEIKIHVLAPLSFKNGEDFEGLKERFQKQGFLRIRLNKKYYELDEEIPFNKGAKNEIFLVIDRLTASQSHHKRLFDAVDQATQISQNILTIATASKDYFFNLSFAVPSTGKSYPPITPHTFSFNTEHGMCLDCNGLGIQYGADFSCRVEQKASEYPFYVLQNLWKEFGSSKAFKLAQNVAKKEGKDFYEPLEDGEDFWFWNGSHEKISFETKGSFLTWKGINGPLSKAATSAHGELRSSLIPLMKERTCSSCLGSRLNPLARHVRLSGWSMADFCQASIQKACHFMDALPIPENKKLLLEETVSQIQTRLSLLKEIGLGYLSLSRSAPSLSGGEAQRVRLSRQLGGSLSGCLYVLDEPTIGLHPENNRLLNEALLKIKNLGNTLVLVEHDPLTVKIADFIIDFGPKAGALGGKIMASGTYSEIVQNEHSLTGLYLSGKKSLPIPEKRRAPKGFFGILQASLHNLQKIDVAFPVGVFSCLSGVSGSGKSSLIKGILAPAMRSALEGRNKKERVEYPFGTVYGIDHFDKVVLLDQDPIGQTARSDVSTYTDVLTPLRQFFALLPQAQIRGLQGKHFSFNHKRGMCTSCWGLGTKMISLQFLPTVKVVCPACQGFRLNPQSLLIKYKDKHLGQILKMSVEEAAVFLPKQPKIVRILETLISVGLGYLALGQDIASLSGGEAQRLRLSRELIKRATGKTLYLFDEPTVGLHSEDIGKLLPIFHSLVDKGNTVIIIEHNLDVLASADYIIDIGPGAGDEGGEIVAQGTPEQIISLTQSKTGFFLKEVLHRQYSQSSL